MITLADAKSELMTARICRKRWLELYQITGKIKYLRFSRQALHCSMHFQWVVNEIERTILITR